MNPMNFIQMFKNIKNPQQAILNMLGNNANPMAQNVLKMAQNNDKEGIEKFARNVCQQKGVDFDKEFANFKDKLGM